MLFFVCYCLYLFVYRYQRLSIAGTIFGLAGVQCLSIAGTKIEHPDFAPMKAVMGWQIFKIAPMVEFLDAPVVGGS